MKESQEYIQLNVIDKIRFSAKALKIPNMLQGNSTDQKVQVTKW